jgi:hypothetical protein
MFETQLDIINVHEVPLVLQYNARLKATNIPIEGRASRLAVQTAKIDVDRMSLESK